MKYLKLTITILIVIGLSWIIFILIPRNERLVNSTYKDSITILKKQLHDCDSSNSLYFFDGITDSENINSLYDSITNLHTQIRLLNTQIQILKKKNNTSADACGYWEDKYYQCCDKLKYQVR